MAQTAMMTPRTTLVIANETGIGTSTAAMRAMTLREQDDREDAHHDSEEVVPRAHAGASLAERAEVEVDLLPVEEADRSGAGRSR